MSEFRTGTVAVEGRPLYRRRARGRVWYVDCSPWRHVMPFVLGRAHRMVSLRTPDRTLAVARARDVIEKLRTAERELAPQAEAAGGWGALLVQRLTGDPSGEA